MNNSINMPLETKLSIRALVSSLDDEDAMTDRDDDTSGTYECFVSIYRIHSVFIYEIRFSNFIYV